LLSFRQKPESSISRLLQIIWTPAFAGVTTFYEAIKFCFLAFLWERLSSRDVSGLDFKQFSY
jgi:hypothetical protein